jgi:hypothetical protein
MPIHKPLKQALDEALAEANRAESHDGSRSLVEDPADAALEAGPGGKILSSYKVTAGDAASTQKNTETILGAFSMRPEDLQERPEATSIPEGAVPLNPSRKSFLSRLAAWLGFAVVLFALQSCGPNWIVPQPATPFVECDPDLPEWCGASPASPVDSGSVETVDVIVVGPDAGIPDDPPPTDGGCPLEEEEEDGDDSKTTLCHVPRGNPGNAHTIRVGAPAVAAHLRHGDYLGPCR